MGSARIAVRAWSSTTRSASTSPCRASPSAVTLRSTCWRTSSSVSGAAPPPIVQAETRSGWCPAKARMWGAPPLPPYTGSLAMPRWSRIAARSSACSANPRPGRRVEAPKPGRSTVINAQSALDPGPLVVAQREARPRRAQDAEHRSSVLDAGLAPGDGPAVGANEPAFVHVPHARTVECALRDGCALCGRVSTAVGLSSDERRGVWASGAGFEPRTGRPDAASPGRCVPSRTLVAAAVVPRRANAEAPMEAVGILLVIIVVVAVAGVLIYNGLVAR